MLCKDVMYEIEKEYPLNYALSWDNVGLLVGRDDKEVKRIYIALDATDEVIDEAVRTGADMLFLPETFCHSPLPELYKKLHSYLHLISSLRVMYGIRRSGTDD